ncbi:MAG: ATP-binding protein [Pseudomonadota bacterium]
MTYLRSFFASMTGHMFFLLLGGMSAAALIAGVASNLNNAREAEQLAHERMADRLQSFISFLDASPPEDRARMLRRNGSGIVSHQDPVPAGTPDSAFNKVLAARDGILGAARAEKVEPERCFSSMGGGGGPPGSPFGRRGYPRPEMPQEFENLRRGRGSDGTFPSPDCRLVTVALSDGTPLRLSIIESPSAPPGRSPLLDPAFVTLLGTGIVLLAYLAAFRASAPLRRLAQASTQLGHDLHRQPLAMTGSSEVRQAVSSFNLMQARLQGHFAERTQMLAAITHDLQTPLTRLRLRLERVEDLELRDRLIGDMQAMRALIDEGLELARAVETPEAVVKLDLDSVLESLVEDAVETGLNAAFSGGCAAVLPLRPLATRRVFANLIDNALVHGGSAEVRAERDGDAICAFVRDHGPGIPDELLERVFDPFFRPDNSRSRETGGTGLGLTIARMLAAKIGATLKLRNHPEGGLEAEVRWLDSDLALR